MCYVNNFRPKITAVRDPAMWGLSEFVLQLMKRNTYSAQCVYTQSHTYIVKISTTYYEASTTIFRLFWDAERWNFSNEKTCDAFRTLLLLPVLAPFFKVYIVKNQRFDSLANSQLVPSDFQLSKALSNLGLMCKKFKTWGTNCELDPEPIFWNFPNENWEICENRAKQAKVWHLIITYLGFKFSIWLPCLLKTSKFSKKVPKLEI